MGEGVDFVAEGAELEFEGCDGLLGGEFGWVFGSAVVDATGEGFADGC